MNEMYHYGITGMKWGIRRYQERDGSLTPAGKRKYGSDEAFGRTEKQAKAMNKAIKTATKKLSNEFGKEARALDPKSLNALANFSQDIARQANRRHNVVLNAMMVPKEIDTGKRYLTYLRENPNTIMDMSYAEVMRRFDED